MGNKHASKFCTDCLSVTGQYHELKTMYERKSWREDGKKKSKWVKTGFYRCKNCDRVLIEDKLYKELRAANNHIIKKLGTYLEE